MDPATTAVDEAAAATRIRNQEDIWGNKLNMIRTSTKLIMITAPRDQDLAIITKAAITKETNTEPTGTAVLLEDPIVRNFTIKNNEI